MARIESLSELEDYEKQKEFERNYQGKNKVVIIIILVAVSLLLGLIVYFISNALLKEEPQAPDSFIGEQISLSDENVQILYQYVTYGTEGTRNQKFVNNREVNLSSFTDQEKLYYALQFAQVEDFEFTGERTANKEKIYTIPTKTIEEYTKLYFGPNASYKEYPTITYPFTFYINKMNVGTMKYNSVRDGYDTTFTANQSLAEKKNTIDPAYGQLISAIRTADGSIILQERVVYTTLRTDNGLFAVDIYEDPERQKLLETKGQLSESDLYQFDVSITGYATTSIVEYTFALSGQTLYFEKSRIIT